MIDVPKTPFFDARAEHGLRWLGQGPVELTLHRVPDRWTLLADGLLVDRREALATE